MVTLAKTAEFWTDYIHSDMDQQYLDNSVRMATGHARAAVSASDADSARYHQREVVRFAKWVEAGLLKIAERRDAQVTA